MAGFCASIRATSGGASFTLPALDAGGGLDYDSYAELNAVIARPPEQVHQGIASGEVALLGCVGRATLRRLHGAVAGADTITDSDRLAILQALEDALTQP